MYETIVIGSGPAGATAAIYLKRFNRDVTVITSNDTALAGAHQIDNYYGFYEVSGKELYDKGVNQLKSLGIDLVDEIVVTTANVIYFGNK